MARVSLSSLAVMLTLTSAAIVGCGQSTESGAAKPDAAKLDADGLLAVGSPVPPLSAVAHDGTKLDLRELEQPTLVYFYPKDETPGCTKEACAFRDVWENYEAAQVLVVGVSTDDDASHRAFAEAHELPFPLVADPEHRWTGAFGVTTRIGYAERVSFLIRDGKIAKVYPGVDPGVHATEVLADAAAL